MALAQQVVTGKITSAKDQVPLVGISVTVKGTTRGTFTSSEGQFSIEAVRGAV